MDATGFVGVTLFPKVRLAFGLVDAEHRWWIFAYLLTAILGSLLEATGLAMLFAFFQVALSPEDFGGILVLQKLNLALGGPATIEFLLVLAGLVFIAFVIRSILLIAVLWLGLAFRRKLQESLTARLFRDFMRQSLLWHMLRGQARLINNIGQNIGQVAQHVVVATLDIIAALIMLLALLATMAILRPVETGVTILILGALAALYLAVLRTRLQRWGQEMVSVSEARWRAVSEPLQGVKSVKVFRVEEYFARRVDAVTEQAMSLAMRQSMVQQLPRFLLEALLVGGILLSIAVALSAGAQIENIIPTMALFAGAAVRMLPQVVGVMSHLQYLRMSEAPLRTLVEDMHQAAEIATAGPHPCMSAGEQFEALELRNITFRYPGADRDVLQDVTLRVRQGEQIAIIGLSGAGKTTLADLIMGLYSPASGEVLLNGQVTDALPRSLFAYVPQDSFVIQGTLRENIALGAEAVDEQQLLQAIDKAALGPLVARLAHGLDTIVGDAGVGLSGGERQRLGLARAFYVSAPVMVMDEPTSALDAETEAYVTKVFEQARGTHTFVVIAHRLSTIKNFDTIVLMEAGQILAKGSFDALYAGSSRFRAMVDIMALPVQSAGPKV